MVTNENVLNKLKQTIVDLIREERTQGSYGAYEFQTLYDWLNTFGDSDFLTVNNISNGNILMQKMVNGELTAQDIDQMMMNNPSKSGEFKLFSELPMWKKVKQELNIPDYKGFMEKDIEQYDDAKKDFGTIPSFSDTDVKVVKENEPTVNKNNVIIQKWCDELGCRGAANKLINNFINKATGGMSTDDLSDSVTFANGLDEIESQLENKDYKTAIFTAKEVAVNMLEDEGFGLAFEETKKQKMDSKKITLSELKSLVKEIVAEMKEGQGAEAFGSMRNHIDEIDINPEADEISPEDLEAAADMYDRLASEENFTAHGHYTISNSGGYEIMLSDDGDMAKVKDMSGNVSDWLGIEFIENPETGESDPVIDPNGYNIPLNMVMRAMREGEEEIEEGNKTLAFKSMRNHVEEGEECDECDEMNEMDDVEMDESEMAMRAGANGKVFEESEEGEKDDNAEKTNESVEDVKLNEAINRFKKIIGYGI